MSIKATISYKNKIAATNRRVANRTGKALKEQGEEVLKLAKEKYVPVQTGNLRDSGVVEGPEITRTHEGGASKIEVDISFGGTAAQYAHIVHEAPPDWGQGKNKYLSRAIEEHQVRMGDELRSEMSSWWQ